MSQATNPAYHYPNSFPTAEAQVVMAAMAGGPNAPSAPDVTHAAWWLGGFAASQVAPGTTIKKGTQPDGACTVGQMKAKLEEACKAASVKKGILDLVSLNIPWQELTCLMFRTVQEGIQILADANCNCIC